MADYDGNNNQQQNIQMDSRSYTSEHLEAVKRVQSCKDYYEILGVTKEATDTELKSTYRKLALQLHPDKNKAPGAEEAFKAVGNAFAVLSDDEKREEYDVYGPEGAPQARSRRSSSPDGFYGGGRYYGGFMSAEDLFEMFFSDMFFRERRAGWPTSEPTLPRPQYISEAERKQKAKENKENRAKMEDEEGKVDVNGKCWKHQRFGNKARECAAPDLCK